MEAEAAVVFPEAAASPVAAEAVSPAAAEAEATASDPFLTVFIEGVSF